MANENFLNGEVHESDGFMEAFHGGGEWWEVAEALRRVETRIWESACEMLAGDDQGHFDAYDLVKEMRETLEENRGFVAPCDDYEGHLKPWANCWNCNRMYREHAEFVETE